MSRTHRLVHALCALALLAAGASGCARAQARTVPGGPPMDMPVPPPREVAVLELEPPVPEAPAEEPVPTPLPRPRPPSPPSEATKPEPPAAEPVPRPDEASKTPTTLQTTPAGAKEELERAIRDSLARAAADLARIDYQKLNPDARSQYATAKRFSQQAEDAVRGRNLLFGKNLADKAASLAAQLAGR